MKNIRDLLKKYSFQIVVALSFLFSVYAFIRFLLPLDVFLWDESHHGFYAMQIYKDIIGHNLGSFWAHTNSQALWMPLHSWIAGLFLVIFGFSYTSARLSSLFLYFVSSLLVYRIGEKLSQKDGWKIGTVSSLLFLTSPMMLHFSVLNMQEMLGIFVGLVTVLIIMINIEMESLYNYLLIGFMLGIAYWTKTNYALQSIFGLALYQLSLIAVSFKEREMKKLFEWTKNNLLIIAGFLPLFILWWATPPFEKKWGLGVTFRQQTAGAQGSLVINTLTNMIYYLQSLISSYNFSFWLGLGCLAALGASFLYYRDKKIRILSLMFLANWLIISVIGTAQERWLSSAVPLLFVLLSFFAVLGIERMPRLGKTSYVLYIIITIISASIIFDLSSLTRYTKETANRSIMFFLYKDSLNQYHPPFFFGMIKRPAFTYSPDIEKKYSDFKVKPASSLRDVLNYFTSGIPTDKSISTMISLAELSPYVIYWTFSDWKVPVFTVNDMPYIQKYFWLSDYFIDLEVDKDSPYMADMLEKRFEGVKGQLMRGGYVKPVGSKRFDDLGLKAVIYKRESYINIQ